MTNPFVTTMESTKTVLDDFIREGLGYRQFGLARRAGKEIGLLLESEVPEWRDSLTWKDFWVSLSRVARLYLTGTGKADADQVEQLLSRWRGLEATLNAQWTFALLALEQSARLLVLSDLLGSENTLAGDVTAYVLNHYYRIIEPDLVLCWGPHLVLIEMKVWTRKSGRGHRYDANQFLKYLRLATEWRTFGNAPRVKRVTHVVMSPARELHRVFVSPDWVQLRDGSASDLSVDLDRCLMRQRTQRDWWEENAEAARRQHEHMSVRFWTYTGSVEALRGRDTASRQPEVWQVLVDHSMLAEGRVTS